MNSRLYLLIIILLITIYYSISEKYEEKNMFLLTKLQKTVKQLAKEEYLASNTESFLKNFNRCMNIEQANEKLLFPPYSSTSEDMNKLQAIINSAFKATGCTVKLITWGEPIKETGYYKLPITFSVSGSPESIFEALKRIYLSNKFIHTVNISAQKTKKLKTEIVELYGTIVAYKLEKPILPKQFKKSHNSKTTTYLKKSKKLLKISKLEQKK